MKQPTKIICPNQISPKIQVEASCAWVKPGRCPQRGESMKPVLSRIPPALALFLTLRCIQNRGTSRGAEPSQRGLGPDVERNAESRLTVRQTYFAIRTAVKGSVIISRGLSSHKKCYIWCICAKQSPLWHPSQLGRTRTSLRQGKLETKQRISQI